MEMYVIVNPYYRSVEIDGEEVKQVVLPFPLWEEWLSYNNRG